MEIVARNVNQMFRSVVEGIYTGAIPTKRRETRNGPTLRIKGVVTLIYEMPSEKVLFNRARDANCFFHLYEAVWMIAGRNDVEPLAYYNSRMRDFSDDRVTFSGAYGYRWRGCGTGFDQIKEIIRQLHEDPNSRRCVLEMWEPGLDLFRNPCKDKCCNLSAVFSVDEGRLDMTVYNRSNDLIWGTLGANACHFAFLLEYVAACLGLQVGVYNQVSCDSHVYTDRFEPEKWLADETGDLYSGTVDCAYCSGTGERSDDEKPSDRWTCPACEGAKTVPATEYITTRDRQLIKVFPLVKDPATFDRECAEFVERHKQDALAGEYTEPFLRDVAQPMCISFHHHKRRDYGDALSAAEHIRADDWQIASTNWLLKRKANYEGRQTRSDASA